MDATDLLMKADLGTSATVLQVLIPPLMSWTPRSSSPTSSSTIMLVKGAQKLLNRAGYQLAVDGVIGPRTSSALASVVGSSWSSLIWATIYSKLLAFKPVDLGTGPGFEISYGSTQKAGFGASEMMIAAAVIGALYFVRRRP